MLHSDRDDTVACQVAGQKCGGLSIAGAAMTVGSGWERPAFGCRRSIPIGACVDFTTQVSGNERSENLRDRVDAVEHLGGLAFNSSWLNWVPDLHRPVIQLKSPHPHGPGPSSQESFKPRGHRPTSRGRYRKCRHDGHSRCRRQGGCSCRRCLNSGCGRRSARRYSGGCCRRLRRSRHDRCSGSRCSGGFGTTAACRGHEQRSDHDLVLLHDPSLSPHPTGGWGDIEAPRCRYAQACGYQARMDSTLAENPEGTEGGPWTTGSL